MAEIIKTLGIVLKSNKHTVDAARMIEVFSPELGRFFACVKGVEKPKAKLAVCAQPFCFGEFVLAEKSGRYTVTDCYVHDSFFDLVYNLDAYVLGSSMLELTSKIVQAGEANVELFKLLLTCLKVLVYEKAEPTALTIKYYIEILRMSGFGFDLKNCNCCGKNTKDENSVGIIYEGTGVVCCKDKSKVDCVDITSGEWGVLKNINNTDINEMSRLKFSSRGSLTSCLKLILKQIYFRTGEKISCLDSYF